MSEGTRSGNGGRRRPFRRRDKKEGDKPGNGARKGQDKPRFDKQRGTMVDRPKWVPPLLGRQPLPKHECPYCGKPIQDLAAAITDIQSGTPAHFDCVLARIAETERVEEGDTITYIGGGRFGIVHFPNPSDQKRFQIKKVVQWEEKDKRASWRKTVADNYSTT